MAKPSFLHESVADPPGSPGFVPQIPHSLFFVRPTSTSGPKTLESGVTFNVTVPTQYLKKRLAFYLAAADAQQQAAVLKTLLGHEWLKGVARRLMEDRMHPCFSSGHGTLKFTSVDGSHPTIKIDAPDAAYPLTEEDVLRVLGPTSFSGSAYFQPTRRDFPTIDAVLVTESQVVFLQATVLKEHKINPQGLRMIKDALPLRF